MGDNLLVKENCFVLREFLRTAPGLSFFQSFKVFPRILQQHVHRSTLTFAEKQKMGGARSDQQRPIQSEVGRVSFACVYFYVYAEHCASCVVCRKFIFPRQNLVVRK